MSTDQTPRQPQALQPDDKVETCDPEAFSGETGDPIWESGQNAGAAASPTGPDVKHPAVPEGTVKPGRLIDLVQRGGPDAPPPSTNIEAGAPAP